MVLKKTYCEDGRWTDVAEAHVQWRALVITFERTVHITRKVGSSLDT